MLNSRQGDRLAYSIIDASTVSGLSRAGLYRAISDGKLNPVKHGRATLILRSDLEHFLKSLPRGADPKESAHGRKMAAARYGRRA